MKKINYLSKPTCVNMGDTWFTSVTLDHFWIIRRFEILEKLFGCRLFSELKYAEVGCGTGLVQFQLENKYNIDIDGFDLNNEALVNNISKKSNKFCYDIHEQRIEFENKYDVIFLMDVIEHIEDEERFIEALKFMLKPDGYILVNVPALQIFYSIYDIKVGHIRRYSFTQLRNVFASKGFSVFTWTYWGFNLILFLLIRKLYLFFIDESKIVEKGISANTRLSNLFFRLLTILEIIPQRLIGSSLFVIFKKAQ
jgi:SAM-dependent methyltransferase